MTDTKIGCVQHDCAKCKALEAQVNTCGSSAGCLHKDARIEALIEMIEAKNAALTLSGNVCKDLMIEVERLMAEQAQPERAPLTRTQLFELLHSIDSTIRRLPEGFAEFARAIEQAHGIKQGGAA